MSVERLRSTALLVDMGRDEFAVLSKMIDMKDLARMDTAMTNRKGRSVLLEGISKGKLCYEGSKSENDVIGASRLRWLELRGIGLRFLSVAMDVPSSLASAVARNSPNLKCLHMNYDVNNNTYMEQLDACCFELEEVKLRKTKPLARLDEYMNAHALVVKLVRSDSRLNRSFCYYFCEKERLTIGDWHRDSSIGRKFSWRRLLNSML